MSTPPVLAARTAPSDPREVVTTHFDAIRRVVRAVAFRQRLGPSAAEELESTVWMRLVEHDYRAIRQYKGQASFGTFLTVIVRRLAMDVQSTEWGRWRPSRQARHLGGTATFFETLVFRDGYTREEAVAQLEASGHHAPSSDIRALAARTRSRPRRFIPVDLIANNLASGDDPTAPLTGMESRKRARIVGRALRDALRSISAEDRLLLRMRHAQGLNVSTIARMLGKDQKALYRKLALLHSRLRLRLSAAGVTGSDAQELIGRPAVRWRSLIAPAPTVAA